MRHCFLFGPYFMPVFNGVAYLYACVGKRGRTTEDLNQRADDRGERGKGRRLAANMQGNTGTRPSDTEERADTDTEIRECMNILTTNKQQTTINNIARNRLQPNRPVNRCRCLFINTQKGGRLEVLPEAHRHSSEQREPP